MCVLGCNVLTETTLKFIIWIKFVKQMYQNSDKIIVMSQYILSNIWLHDR